MVSHLKQLELMSAVLDGEATKEEAAELYAHLETCEDCARTFRALKSISDAMPEDLVPVPEALLPGIMSAIATGQAKAEKAPTPIKKRRVWGYVAAAACLALTIFSASRFGFLDFLNNGGSAGYSTQTESAGSADTGSGEGEESVLVSPIPSSGVVTAPTVSPGLPDASPTTSAPQVSQSPESPAPEGKNDEVRFSALTELLNDAYSSNSAFMTSETDRLKAAESVAFYDGEFIFNREGEKAAPVLDNLDEAAREMLFGFLSSGTILEYDEGAVDELSPYCSFLFTGVARSEGEGAEDLCVTVWMYGSRVLFRLSSQPPILYASDCFPIDFEDFAESLLGAAGL
jgi:hypothetical protein